MRSPLGVPALFALLAAVTLAAPQTFAAPLHPRQACAFNYAAMRRLCPSVTAGSASSPDVGSPNGRWAFIVGDGLPRLVQFWGLGWSVRWRSPLGVTTRGCPDRLAAAFEASGNITYSCGAGPRARVVVADGGRVPAAVSIDDSGVVLFADSQGRAVLTVSASGATPVSAYRVVAVGAPSGSSAGGPTTSRTTSTSRTTTSGTTSRTTTTSASASPPSTPSGPSMSSGPLVTPTWDTANTLRGDCRYVPVPYRGGAGRDASNVFNIELVSCGSDPETDAIFVRAAQRWMNIITTDLTDFDAASQGLRPITCLRDFSGREVATCSRIDDLLIGYQVLRIDGTGGTLGAAGPNGVRPRSFARGAGLPFSGFVVLDSADLAALRQRSPQLAEATVLHEIGHVLGIGTRWSDGLIDPANCDARTAGPAFLAEFTGSNAARGLAAIGGQGRPRVEDRGGRGTACGHWKDSTYGTELMTGSLSPRSNPLSLMTALSLADLGYGVDERSAEIEAFDVRRVQREREEGWVEIGGCTGGPWETAVPIPVNGTA
ncbi:hypothetical protein DFJ74DRAFT_643640 [Hyaloraphidium curvatum]|nr:hypothetical protein DFJ74DRAFT_643640 [Hyaloraphidium curvatum]